MKSSPFVHHVPEHADDHESNQRNLDLLREELDKPKQSSEVLRDLMCRTFSFCWRAFVTCGELPTL